MVVNIELSDLLKSIVMVCFLIISSIIYFRRKEKSEKKLDYNYVLLGIFALVSGIAFHSGMLLFLRGLNIEIENRIFDDVSYGLITGFVLMMGSIVSLTILIDTFTKAKKEEK